MPPQVRTSHGQPYPNIGCLASRAGGSTSKNMTTAAPTRFLLNRPGNRWDCAAGRKATGSGSGAEVPPAGLDRRYRRDRPRPRRGRAQGASTISQQYARIAADLKGVTYSRKVREAVMAWKLDKKYSKQQILEFYLNTVPFGRGAYGIEAAAQAFFGKTANRNAAPG